MIRFRSGRILGTASLYGDETVTSIAAARQIAAEWLQGAMKQWKSTKLIDGPAPAD
jgi:hypothetical protein